MTPSTTPTHESGALARLIGFSVRRALPVLLAWLAIAALLNLTVPTIEEVVAKDSTPFVPADAPSMQAQVVMDAAFGDGESNSYVFVVLQRDATTLTDADRAWYEQMIATLDADDENVAYVQDVTAREAGLDAVTSEDGHAMYLVVGMTGQVGAPSSTQQIEAVRDHVHEDPPAGLDVSVTGPAATIADLTHEVEGSIALITIATVVLIALILLLIYRSFTVMALTLGVIGLSLAVARSVVAVLATFGLPVSTFTVSFVTGVVLGAGTDYMVFLLSRYFEMRRRGVAPTEAARLGSSAVAVIVAGSALTVILANAANLLADIAFFRTTGPAVSVSVGVTLAICLTLAPALIGLAGRRGWLEPRPVRGEARWARLAQTVVTRPVRVLTLGLIPLLALAMLYPLLVPSFDQSGSQPDDTESNHGYRVIADHFPRNELVPDYVVISSDHDLRTTASLAALEQMAQAIRQVPGIEQVRGVTRPDGTPITESSIGYQAGVVGDRLGEATDGLASGAEDAGKLADGAQTLADGAGTLSSGADAAVDGAGQLLTGVSALRSGIDDLADGSGDLHAGSTDLRDGLRRLADGLKLAADQTAVAVDGLRLVDDALRTKSLTCGIDPACRQARDGIRRIYVGERDQLLPGLRTAADAARRLANGSTDLTSGLAALDAGLARADAGAAQLADGQRLLHDRLGELAHGADQVADGAGQVSDGTAQSAEAVARLEEGLTEASSYLQGIRTGTRSGGGGFYLPSSALDSADFAAASGLLLSADGHTARYLVLQESPAWERAAMDRLPEIRAAADHALDQSELAGARIDIAGITSVNHDIEHRAGVDFGLVALAAVLTVLGILVWVLRSLVAPLLLVATVALSYASAMGLAVLIWQVLLDTPLEWSVPPLAFILLVAVGADYNLLLVKRIQEESAAGDRAGIARAVTATGGVITTAGIIFAASMFALMAGSVTTLAQVGFTVGMGLLLDTVIVRSLVVPSAAALLGPLLWWPRRVFTPR